MKLLPDLKQHSADMHLDCVKALTLLLGPTSELVVGPTSFLSVEATVAHLWHEVALVNAGPPRNNV